MRLVFCGMLVFLLAACGAGKPAARDAAAGNDGSQGHDGSVATTDGTVADMDGAEHREPTATDAAIAPIDGGPTFPSDTCTTGIAYQATARVLSVVPATTGLVIVHPDEVLLVSRSSTVLRRLPWPREILSGISSGERIVILDRGVLTTLDRDLNTLGTVNLVESCVAAVSAGPDWIVCGPGDDWQRVFYTYEIRTPKLAARSQAVTYEGIAMQSVPGRPWFLTKEKLFALDDKGEAKERSRIGFSSTPEVIPPLVFAGDPATHAIDRMNNVFELHIDCQPSCFVKVGMWTTARSGGAFDGPGSTVLAVSSQGAWQRLDALSGSPVSVGAPATPPHSAIASARPDYVCGAATVVLQRSAPTGGPVQSVEQVPYDGGDGGQGQP